MSGVTLVLGPVAFQDFQVPSSIPLGGQQRLAVHELPGGGRVIDVLGRSDADLSWTGVLSGPAATDQLRLLDAMRVQGLVLPLSWDIFYYSVIIQSLEGDYRNSYWIPYRITCKVLRDEAQATPGTVASLASSIINDLGFAEPLALAGGVALDTLQTALAPAAASTLGTAAWLTATNAVASSQAALGLALSAAGSTVVAFNNAPSSAATVSAATAAAGQLAVLSGAQAYLSRLAANLSGALS